MGVKVSLHFNTILSCNNLSFQHFCCYIVLKFTVDMNYETLINIAFVLNLHRFESRCNSLKEKRIHLYISNLSPVIPRIVTKFICTCLIVLLNEIL